MRVFVLGRRPLHPASPDFDSFFLIINWELLGFNRVILMGGDRVVGGRAVLMEPTPAVSVFH